MPNPYAAELAPGLALHQADKFADAEPSYGSRVGIVLARTKCVGLGARLRGRAKPRMDVRAGWLMVFQSACKHAQYLANGSEVLPDVISRVCFEDDIRTNQAAA